MITFLIFRQYLLHKTSSLLSDLLEMQEKLILIVYLREAQVKLLLGLPVLHFEPSIHVCFVDLEVLKIDLKHNFLLLFLAEDKLVVKGKHEAGVDLFWRIRLVLLLLFGIGDVPTGDGDFLQKLMEVFVELFLNILEGLFGYSSI